MTRIAVEDQYYTLVNIFETTPEHQNRLIEIWQGLGAADERSGLISVNAHLSDDGKAVISYIQWRDKSAWENILVDPSRQERFKEVMTFATFDSIHCEVVYTQRNASLGGSDVEVTDQQDYYTVIEVARTAAGRQQELVEIVTKPNETLAVTPGYVSHTVHRDFEGDTVVNYSQWESKASYEAFRADQDAQRSQPDAGHLADVREFAGLRIAYITETTQP